MSLATEKSVREASSSSTSESILAGSVQLDLNADSSSSRSSRSSSRSSKKSSKVADICVAATDLSPLGSISPRQVDTVSGSAAKNRASSSKESVYVQDRIAQRKKQLVDNLIAIIEEWLDNALGLGDEACDGDECGRSTSSSRNGSEGNSRASRRPVAGQKRQKPGSEDQGTPGDDMNFKNGKKRINKQDKTERKFACPFFKLDPIKYNCRTCCGPGFPTYARLKEHLVRRHFRPSAIQCERCCDCFESEASLKKHMRSKKSCPLRDNDPADPTEGFGNEKKIRLDARPVAKKTDVERWIDTYRMLFDLPASAKDIPSPFHENTSSDPRLSKNSDRLDIEAYAQALRKELPPLIRRKLEDEIDREISGVKTRLRGKLFDMVRDTQVKLFRTWASISPPEEDRSLDNPNTPPIETRAASPAVVVSETADSMPYQGPSPDFMPFGIAAYINNYGIDWPQDAGGEPWGHCEGDSFQDSGYRTTGSNSARSVTGHFLDLSFPQ